VDFEYFQDGPQTLQRISGVVNSNADYTKKRQVLQRYAIIKDLTDCPAADIEETHMDKIKEKLVEIANEKSDIDTGHLTLEEHLALIAINKSDHYLYGSKVKTLIADQEKRFVSRKPYVLGKTYGRRVLSGIKAPTSPTNLTLYLIYGLVSRIPENISLGEEYFESEKIAAIKKLVPSNQVFDAVEKFIPKLKEGNEEAVQPAIDSLRKLYGRREEVSDILGAIEGSIHQRLDFDSLSFDM
jgi:hypothetical protein